MCLAMPAGPRHEVRVVVVVVKLRGTHSLACALGCEGLLLVLALKVHQVTKTKRANAHPKLQHENMHAPLKRMRAAFDRSNNGSGQAGSSWILLSIHDVYERGHRHYNSVRSGV
jgi:hypothetical protein